MAVSVFLVIAGRAEDFAVVGAFSTQHAAAAVRERLRGEPCYTEATVEEYGLDEVTAYWQERLRPTDAGEEATCG